MPCSAVTLSLATVTSIIAVALLAIAFATDNWLYIEVRRSDIQNYLSTHSDPQNQALLESLNSKYYYYTRTKGLFRICYPKERERPPGVKIYLSPVETYCSNVNYYIPDENNDTRDFTDDAWTRLHMGRSMIALFIISFISVFAAFCTGVTGCWRRSPGNITGTAILMLVACLLSAGAMGLWHGVEYYEKEKQVGEEFYQQWSNILQDNSEIYYDWSFVLGWLGVFSCLGASFIFFFAACCLSNEREKENLNNVQYIMPVYPQKQQYAYAGYPVPQPQPYTGPYYTTGSAYGPYSY
ncbi:uncharacterized protein LOC108908434 isoform X1 [Anoplophora glabripennis]|uniref:uncharacterized protein LOC108908434 isoform X1 n=1 Tax=Anoplophora glabripennis TaxID=217634 RepID=UPI0008756BF9|nr:uncharacterized protein LOC108908434 isoform X1 [Anoplophora glabripennis]